MQIGWCLTTPTLASMARSFLPTRSLSAALLPYCCLDIKRKSRNSIPLQTYRNYNREQHHHLVSGVSHSPLLLLPCERRGLIFCLQVAQRQLGHLKPLRRSTRSTNDPSMTVPPDRSMAMQRLVSTSEHHPSTNSHNPESYMARYFDAAVSLRHHLEPRGRGSPPYLSHPLGPTCIVQD